MPTTPKIPLDERCEFLSEQWLATANSFLESRSTELSATDFSFSYRYFHPPPHLNPTKANFLGITYRVEKGKLAFEPSFDPSAESKAEGSYNALLPLILTYFGDDKQSADRKFYEHTQRLGSQASAIEPGPKPLPQCAQTVFAEMHDYMALRTLNNPDVLNRAQGLGLGGNLEHLDEFGYTIMPNAFSDEFGDALREEAARNHDRAPKGSGFRQGMLLKRGKLWEEAAQHPWVLAVAEYLLGRGCLLYQSDTIVKNTNLDTHPGLHSDYGASRVPEPFPAYCIEATAVWAIDDFDLPAGPTTFLPKSHEIGTQVPPGTSRDGCIPLTMEKGSIAFWHGGSWHGAMPRTKSGTRTSLHNAYCRYFVRPLESYLDIDAEIVDRNGTTFSTLCGLDNPFGKSTEIGPDFARMQYASKSKFGDLVAG